MKVLIAEDSAVARMMLESAIVSFGHECIVAEDGLQAWEKYLAQPVDVVISGWVMPKLDGPDLCRRVRAQSNAPYTYFIFLTALGEKKDFLAGMECGADDLLRKPLDLDELRARLLAASRVTRVHRELAEKSAELQRLNAALHQTARTDTLTGLGNRLRLKEDLDALHGRSARYGHNYAVALCDLDHFKDYNDRYGHLAGDEALRAVARVLAQQGRQGDMAYRFGGEELLVVLPEQTLDSARIAAERIRKEIAALGVPHVGNAPFGVVTISIGIAEFGESGNKRVDDVLREADAALYRAKSLGRNRVAIHRAPVRIA